MKHVGVGVGHAEGSLLHFEGVVMSPPRFCAQMDFQLIGPGTHSCCVLRLGVEGSTGNDSATDFEQAATDDASS